MSSSSSSTSSTPTSSPLSVLSSLIRNDEWRRTSTERNISISRAPGSNVDVWRWTANSSSSETSGSSNFNSTATDDDGKESILLAECHLGTFLDFTRGPDRIPYEPSYEVAAAVALAAHQLNVGDGSVIPEIARLKEENICPELQFSVEFFDTQLLEGPALRQAIEFISRRPEQPPQQRQPCALLGAVRSAVSIPLAIISGVQGYPQLSGFSTSPDLDDKDQYPLFARTIPSDQGNAIPIILYFSRNLQMKHLSVLHINDEYGNFFAEALREAALQYAPGMVIETIDLPPPQTMTNKDIQEAISRLAESGFRYTFCILFRNDVFDSVMEEAYRQQIAGDGLHQWFFSDSFNSALVNRQVERNSPLHLAYRGVGLLEASGGRDGEPFFNTFHEKLLELSDNPEDLAYLNSLLPNDVVSKNIYDEDIFSPLRSGYISFVYEAAVTAGLAACQAMRKDNNNNEILLTGQEHYDQIKATSFTSMSGKVTLDDVTGSRDPISTLFKVANHIEDEAMSNATMVQFKSVVTDFFQQGQWKTQTDYIFNDGTTALPVDIPPLVTQQDYFNDGLRIASWAMFVIVILLSIGLSVWTYWNHKTRVVRASQPIFLQMICVGVIITAMTIVANMIDDSVASDRGCDIACNAVPWLLSLGFSIVFAALYTKTYRISLILDSSSHFRRVVVTYRDVLKPMIVHLGGESVSQSVGGCSVSIIPWFPFLTFFIFTY